MKSSTWSTDKHNKIDFIKKNLSKISLSVRNAQYKIFVRMFRPNSAMKVIDVGISPNEALIDTNYFEKVYPFPQNLTAVSVEDCSNLKIKYPKIKIVEVKQNSELPYKRDQFDIVVSWATLEHVGDYKKQEFFLNELLRIGKKIFVTTPYRGCIYEPHTGLFLLHWFPLKIFRNFLLKTGNIFWAKSSNLNPLFIHDIQKMKLSKPVYITIYKTLNLIPSHLIITNH